MPIKPELRYFYPIDWPQISHWVRFVRAKGHCQVCGRPHGETVRHLGDGRWWDETEQTWRDGRGRKVPSPYLRRLESSPPTAGCPDAAEREGRLWIRHAEKTASPYLRFDRSAVTMIPRPAGERRWTMGPICLGGGQPWRGAVTHRPSTQCDRYQPIACLKIIMLASSPLLPGSFQS